MPTEKSNPLSHKDLADAIRQFYLLESDIHGQEGAFCEWAQVAYDFGEGFDSKYSEEAKRICDAFREVVDSCGQTIAQQLYNTQTVILATEIRNAAKYLHLGGQMKDIPRLADAGFFLAKMDDDRLKCIVMCMNGGGNIGDIGAI